MEELENIAKTLVAPGKGILAADESFGTMEKRFASIGIGSTQDLRREYRAFLFTTSGIEEFISGIIMFDETLRLTELTDGKTASQILIEKGIIPGIKVDEGMKDFVGYPGDKLTEGLNNLSGRLNDYKNLGAKFAKWRAAFSISEVNPSIQCVEENSNRFAEYASVCQSNGFVPIVEPEVLMDGNHSIDRCYEVTRSVLRIVILKLKEKNVNFKAMLLKPNMVVPGKDSGDKSTPEVIAQKTIEVLKECVPSEIPGIVFLSGGQTPEEATNNLKEMNKLGNVPWQLSFSFGRALQEPALKAWSGNSKNISNAQQEFLARAKMNHEARYKQSL
jgi:fructose-bisphosphate aldolase class I